MGLRFFFLGGWIALGLTGVLCAAEPMPGHSSHGEAFNEGPRQSAVLLPGMGRIDFPVTTAKAEAQAFFNQGVAQLHGFWYFEAERSFRQVAFLDPGCAMAYWGMAMANVNNEKRAKGLLTKATSLKASASAREKLWIAALENFYRDDKRDKKARALDFIRDLETIVQDHPADVEAKAFLAWKIWHAKSEAPLSSRQAVDALLEQVFAARPEHPAHHYRIHLWDDSKPIRAIASAARCGQSTPGIAHLWHMPGHTYSKLRRFDDAAWQQEASARVDHGHLNRTFVLPDQIHNYAHNQEWLVRTYNELGRVPEALALASNLIAIPQHPDFNTLDKGDKSASFGRTRLLETMEKWELWEDLAATTVSQWVGPVSQVSHEVTRFRAVGVAGFALNQPERIVEALARLEELKKKDAPKPDEKAKQEEKDKEKDKPRPVDSAILELRALQAVLGNDPGAPVLLDEAGDKMSAVSRSRCWLRLGKPGKAADLVPKFPQDLVGLAAKTEILLACNREPEARTAFGTVRTAAFALDANLPVARRLADLARKFAPDSPWPAPAPVRTDSGTRPSLDSLGPKLWGPPQAPEWEATGLDGAIVSGNSLKGQPRVLLFYLGAGCSHCVEQLQAFAKSAPGFSAAGMSIHAISTETPGEASRVDDTLVPKGPPPFDVFCDPGLKAFRAFRAYDGFEDDPLHATVLLDAAGRIRWIDVSWKPFVDAPFLLAEAQRLLALPEHP